jgi:uncharacterized protein DUF2817
MSGRQTYYSPTYQQAQQRFLSAAHAAGAQLHRHRHPTFVAADGSPLDIDVARLGPPSADRLLVLVSGTHGIEGFCGSACQTGLLTGTMLCELEPDTAVLLVHALNPYGFAFETRVNEDNVDLNRNFVDHDRSPANRDYETLHAALVPPDWHGPARVDADRFIGRFLADAGPRRLQEAVTRGQYTHADGLFYGGAGPVWSNRRWREIICRFIVGHRHIAYIDLHTGLGVRGAGEPIFRGGRDADAVERARRWYGEALTLSETGTSSSTPIIGNTASALADEIGSDTTLTAITLEFGTVPATEALAALRADNWLRLQFGTDPAAAAAIKQSLRDAFYPSDPPWRQAVWQRAQEVLGLALAALAAETPSRRTRSRR